MVEFAVNLEEEDVPGTRLNKNLNECTIVELKRWLEFHGLKNSGKKDELVGHARMTVEIVKVDPKIDRGTGIIPKSRTFSRI